MHIYLSKCDILIFNIHFQKDHLNQFIKNFDSESRTFVRLKCMMIVTTLVNFCDIIDYLIKCVCNDPDSFEWLVQLRFFYNDDTDEYLIRQTKAILKYGFEYLGNRQRLIVTPLTERYVLRLLKCIITSKFTRKDL